MEQIKKEKEETTAVSTWDLFALKWESFKMFVAQHKDIFINDASRSILLNAVDQTPELALVTIAQNVAANKAHVAAIRMRKVGYFEEIFGAMFDVSHAKLTPDVEAKAFDFFEFFLLVIEDLGAQHRKNERQ